MVLFLEVFDLCGTQRSNNTIDPALDCLVDSSVKTFEIVLYGLKGIAMISVIALELDKPVRKYHFKIECFTGECDWICTVCRESINLI